jgi:lysophospholipase L1-like esterase
MRRILPAFLTAAFVVSACAAGLGPGSVADEQTGDFESPATVRVAALGDSYTAGTGIDQGRWPDQLASRIRTEGLGVDIEVVAGSGWTTKRLTREVSRAGILGALDVVILAIGANDVVLGFGEENFLEGLDLVTGEIERLSDPGTQVIVLSIPDFRATPWGQERLDRGFPIERYNRLLEAYAEHLGASFVDVTSPSAAAVRDPALVAPDGIHFSATMYAAWAETIASEITRR